ncbi:MAG: hypothetical protein HKN82_19335 [Akkermansiaceae bacterium]|nr:hypothetical protein [Akkermansiaceae bacterium]NNM31345.1 hypothetical protein [Akkermansiaceae bacterium]
MALLSAAALEGGAAWRELSKGMHATLAKLSAEFPGGGTATLPLPLGDGCRAPFSGSGDPGLPAQQMQLQLRWRRGGPKDF